MAVSGSLPSRSVSVTGDWFGGAQRLDLLAGVAAAQFGVGGDGQVPGTGGGLLPVLPVGHGLGEGVFSLLVEVAQGPVAGGQGLVPLGAVVVAGLAGGLRLRRRADRAQAGVEGAEPGQSQFLSDVAGCPGGLGGVGVAEQPQPAVGHGADVWAVGWAEGGEGLVPGGPLVWCLCWPGSGPIGSSGWL